MALEQLCRRLGARFRFCARRGRRPRPQSPQQRRPRAPRQRRPHPGLAHPLGVGRPGRAGPDAGAAGEPASAERGVGQQVAVVLEHRLLGRAEAAEVGADGGDPSRDELARVAGRGLDRRPDLPLQAFLPAGGEAAEGQTGGAEDEARPPGRLAAKRLDQFAGVALLDRRLGGGTRERAAQQRPRPHLAPGDLAQRLGDLLGPVAVGAGERPCNPRRQHRGGDRATGDGADRPDPGQQPDLVQPGQRAEVEERRPVAVAGQPQRLFAALGFARREAAEPPERRRSAAKNFRYVGVTHIEPGI